MGVDWPLLAIAVTVTLGITLLLRMIERFFRRVAHRRAGPVTVSAIASEGSK
jgi:hypothetical protein